MMRSPKRFPVPLVHINETNSTNNYLQALCARQQTEEFTTVVADFKRPDEDNVAIRGKQNLIRTFFSVLWFFQSFWKPDQQFLISQIVSLAIKEELDTYTTDISIKWPNDIYWKDKKICGMLIENDLMGRNISQSIAGVGININQEVFHSSAPNPVSISDHRKTIWYIQYIRAYNATYSNLLRLTSKKQYGTHNRPIWKVAF